jgi:hypothetical protein
MFIGIGLNLVRGGGSASPASLFAASEPGAWYDPSDLTTLFQDSAGTTPVTTAGQTVGKILDKSGRGNHATQATLAQRPTYGINPIMGTRNLLTYTEQFDNAAWTKSNATITADTAVAPDGTTTADSILDTAVSNIHYCAQSMTALSPSGKTYTVSAYGKANTLNYMTLGISDISSGSLYAVAVFNLSTGAVSTSGAAGTGYSVVSSSISSVGSGWYRCVVTAVAGTSVSFLRAVVAPNKAGTITAAAGGFESYLGDGSGFYAWGAQLEESATTTAYQKVVSQYEVTEAGIASASYISFDGVDDGMVTGTITPAIDKVQVFAGIRRISDANTGILAEFSPALGSNAGSWHMLSPAGSGVAGSGFASKGTVQAANNTVSPAAPITEILTGIGDIAGDVNIFRKNGVATSVLTDQGTGNFLPYVLYIGRRNGTSLAVNGRIYSLIVRFGANLTAGQITSTESWVNSKTGAF